MIWSTNEPRNIILGLRLEQLFYFATSGLVLSEEDSIFWRRKFFDNFFWSSLLSFPQSEIHSRALPSLSFNQITLIFLQFCQFYLRIIFLINGHMWVLFPYKISILFSLKEGKRSLIIALVILLLRHFSNRSLSLPLPCLPSDLSFENELNINK